MRSVFEEGDLISVRHGPCGRPSLHRRRSRMSRQAAWQPAPASVPVAVRCRPQPAPLTRQHGRRQGAQGRRCALTPARARQAEVQALHQDGSVSLHTRSLKYGKVPAAPAAQPPVQSGFRDAISKRQCRQFSAAMDVARPGGDWGARCRGAARRRPARHRAGQPDQAPEAAFQYAARHRWVTSMQCQQPARAVCLATARSLCRSAHARICRYAATAPAEKVLAGQFTRQLWSHVCPSLVMVGAYVWQACGPRPAQAWTSSWAAMAWSGLRRTRRRRRHRAPTAASRRSRSRRLRRRRPRGRSARRSAARRAPCARWRRCASSSSPPRWPARGRRAGASAWHRRAEYLLGGLGLRNCRRRLRAGGAGGGAYQAALLLLPALWCAAGWCAVVRSCAARRMAGAMPGLATGQGPACLSLVLACGLACASLRAVCRAGASRGRRARAAAPPEPGGRRGRPADVCAAARCRPAQTRASRRGT